MKKIFAVVLCVLILVGLTGCDTIFPYGREYSIFGQINTDWISEDGNITIHVNEDGMGDMVLFSDDIGYVCGGLYNNIYVYEVDDDGVHSQIERWHAYYSQDGFSITVEESQFFEKGTEIKFYKVEE